MNTPHLFSTLAISATHVGILLDAGLLAAVVLWVPPKGLVQPSTRFQITSGVISLLSALAIVASVNIGYISSTLSLLAAVTLCGQTMRYGTASSYLALLHLARLFRLVLSPVSHAVPGLYIAMYAYALLAWMLLAPSDQRLVARHVRGVLCLDTYSFAQMCSRRVPTFDDIDDPTASQKLADSIAEIQFDPSKRYFVIRGLLSATWRHTAIMTGLDTLVGMAPHYQSIVLAKILEAIDHKEVTDHSEILRLWALWSLLSLYSIGKSYLSRLESCHKDMITAAMRTKLLHIFTARHDCPRMQEVFDRAFWYKMHATTTGIPMLLYILSKTLANSINIWVLSTKIGWRAVIPIAVTASYSILSHWITAKTNEFNKQNKIKRQPRFYTNFGTMVANMRTVKFYGWERAFYNVRSDDYSGNTAVPTALRLLGFTIGLIGGSISQVAAALTVISYLQSSNTLSYPDILLVISSTAALSELVLSVAGTPEVLQRMRKNEEDIARLIVEPVQKFLDHGPLSATKAIEMSSCEFQWGEGKFSLKPITLNIAAGELIVIMGSVGSGKSSLVSALCGSMQLTGGDGCIYGRIGYVGQKPWIMNATFRENVVFGREYDEAFYQEVLVACALIEDVKGFPAGDMSEIGHKGINLSGGQKTRLALARAIYSRADVYILDDILAAVDAYVERHIVDNVLTGHGIISSKTRILVTHSEHIAPLATKFITMTDGRVEVASQVPITVSASSPQSPIQPNGGSSNNSSEGGSGMFTANPEENMQAFEWPYIWRYLAMSGYSAVGISLLIQVLSTYAIFYVENLRMDLLSDKNHDTMMRSLQQYLVADALVDVFRLQIHQLEIWIRRRIWSQRVNETTRVAILGVLLHMPLSLFESLPRHLTHSLFRMDRNILGTLLPQLLCAKVETVFNAGYVIASAIRRLPVIFLFALPTIWITYLVRGLCTAARDNLWKMFKSSRRYNPYGLTAEVCTGSDMMRLNGVLEPYLNRCTSLYLDGWLLDIKWRLPDMFEAVVRDLSIAGMNSVVLLFNIWRRLDPNSTLTPGEVEMMMRLSEQFLHRLRQMLGIATNLDNHLPSLARYYTYQELPREELGRSTGASLPEIWPSEGTIEFQDYSMRYRKDLDLVLNQVAFAVRRQEKIGIVGRTGAGKSSLTHALMRMVTPASGSVYIDGVDISSIGLSALRSSISIIPQDPALFNGTIRENMDPLHEFTDSEIWAAIRRGRIEDLVNTPTELYRTDDQNSGPWVEGTGLDKWVEDGGKNFSIGQRQLVSLCRALLWKRKILVLDEATANVDTRTDRIMQRVIREEFSDCTILTIAHRLRTVMDSDRILVMDQGRVAEFDTPANLLAQDSLFKSLVESMELNEKR